MRALARGADCVLRWAWLNPGTLDGWWQLIQTTDGSDAPVRDPYYGYGTLMRYVVRRASVLQATVSPPADQPQTIHAAALRNRDGSRTLLVVNDDYANCKSVLIRMPTPGAAVVRKIVNDPVRKHRECEPLSTSGALEHADILSPMSLTVYTTRDE